MVQSETLVPSAPSWWCTVLQHALIPQEGHRGTGGSQ